jgi:hypothetical protein
MDPNKKKMEEDTFSANIEHKIENRPLDNDGTFKLSRKKSESMS